VSDLTRAAVLPLLLIALSPSVAAAQAATEPRFTTEASAVVLDVVVRNARGEPVTGLTREDFEVFEGRSRQTITVFEGPAARDVDRAGPTSPRPSGTTAVAGVSATPPRVVALVFEQLGPTARDLAAKAARRLVESLEREDFAAVFTVDRAIHTVASYTPASPIVHDAIDAAANRPGLPLRRAGIVPGAEFASEAGGQPTPETRDEAKRNRGFATLDALSQIIRGLSLLQGERWSCCSPKVLPSTPPRK
jgi:VWFA-related protein